MKTDRELIIFRIDEKIRLAREKHNLEMEKLDQDHKNYMEGFVENTKQLELEYRNLVLRKESDIVQKEVMILALEVSKLESPSQNMRMTEDELRVFAESMTEKLIEMDNIKKQLDKVGT